MAGEPKLTSQSIPTSQMYIAAKVLLAEHGSNERASTQYMLGVLAIEVIALRERLAQLEAKA